MHSVDYGKGFLLFLLAGILSVQVGYADYLRTSKEAPVRKDSSSSSVIIKRVEAGTVLPLLNEDRLYGTGYWKVRLPSGRTGYIYKTHVRLIPGPLPDSNGAGPAGYGEGELQVHVINVGQGDGILIICPGGTHQLVIDSGGFQSGAELEFRNYIRAYQQETDPIEVVIATHPHADHIGGMNWLLQTYQTGLYVDNGRDYESDTYETLEETILNENINRGQLTDPEEPEIDFCIRQDVTAQVLRPADYLEYNEENRGADANDYSVVVRVDYRNSSFLFTGDAEENLEELLLSDPETRGYLDVDWLKVGHHGSNSSSTPAFIETVSPRMAAISSGGETIHPNDEYHHPRMSTLETLFSSTGIRDRQGIATTIEAYDASDDRWESIVKKEAVYITNNEGDLVFLSDGDDIWKAGDRNRD